MLAKPLCHLALLAFLNGAASTLSYAQTTVTSPTISPASIEQWGLFELALPGPTDANPFTDFQLAATFTHDKISIAATGFYDGNGIYRIRFMPTQQGEWSYTTTSNAPALSAKTGTFTATRPAPHNHGPVHAARTFHFDYADNTPYFQIGTTCYNWQHELDAAEQLTLASLKESPFNKVRMCVLPTSFPTKRQLYPYVSNGIAATLPAPAATPDSPDGAANAQGRAPGGRGGRVPPMPAWDYTRFNPEFFQHLEKRITDLRDLNIQADLILYTPYEYRTGFNGANAQGHGLDAAGDERYLKYLVARLSAYRNVWWSMANEYDLMGARIPGKRDDAYWDKLCQTVSNADPFHHELSIHFSQHIYSGNNQPWITHISIQNGAAVADFGRANLYRDVYYKPIVFDEINYEGKSAARWGQLSGEEMTEQFWHAYIDGTYAGHGETLSGWISSGGKLAGESPARLAFLKKIMDSGPPTGINPVDKWRDLQVAGKGGEFYIVYFGRQTPTEWTFSLPNKEGLKPNTAFKVEILDTWNMTITPVEGAFTTIAGPTRYTYIAQNNAKITLPGKPYQALRITVAH